MTSTSQRNAPTGGKPEGADPERFPHQPLPSPKIDPSKPRICLGLDVHLGSTTGVSQKGSSGPAAPRKYNAREELLQRIRAWVAEGFQVFCVQESCGFGFVLHRELVAAGAQSFLITPIALNGRRKTDKLDARALCQRLVRWVDGDKDQLKPIRIPTEDEQRRRETTRRRQFLAREIRCLANSAHGFIAEHRHASLPSHWWGPRNWKRLRNLDPWELGVLERLREVLLVLEKQVQELEAEALARVQGPPMPKGLGALTLTTLDAEVCDWHRFRNRKQPGSFTGCCPGEHSSGENRRIGSIDRIGNARMRALLVEAVWRMLRWQPLWKSALRMRVKIADGPSLKKKCVVALARQLAVDLWRWRTGRSSLEDLGWIPA
jgi:transposase